MEPSNKPKAMPQTLAPEELAARTSRLRERARILGASPLAILAGNGKAALVGRRLANDAGAPLVPINPLLRPAEIAHILEDSQATHLLVEEGREADAEAAVVALTGKRPQLLALEEEPLAADQVLVFEGAASAAASAAASVDDDDIGATLIYTSGTTGRPKGCFRTAAQEAARARELIATYSLTSRDVQLIACPLAHSAPGILVRTAHAIGARSVILPRFTAQSFRDAWQQHRASFFFLVPTQYRRLLDAFASTSEQLWSPPSSTRAALVAGAPLRDALREDVKTWLGSDALWQFYGSSETGTISIAAPGFSAADGVGKLAPNVEVEVRDAQGRLCPPNALGEMFVRSPTVMTGYWPSKRPEHADGFISVGDLGYMSDDGSLHLVDRKNDTIISGGVNVYPAEVEAALLAMEGIDAAVVVGIDDPNWGQRVVALVACSGGQSADELRQACRSSLAAYKVPKQIVLWPLAKMAVGASGKPLRRRARELLLELQPAST